MLASSRPSLGVRLLGRGRLEAQLGDGPALELSLRHAEILALLALYPEGLTCEQLTLLLYGDEGNRISTRAQMSRLRTLLGRCVVARPYRLATATDTSLTISAAILETLGPIPPRRRWALVVRRDHAHAD